LFVREFRLTGVADHPAEGVTVADLEGMAENMRREHLGLADVDDNGFTAEERRRISDFMRRLIDDPDDAALRAELETLVEGLRSERIRREAGMTIGQIQEVAAAITERYRRAGFILAQAFIPAQEVDDGVVTIEVFEGKLGNVRIEGNEMYSDDILARPFDDLIDAPVQAGAIESAILTASDYPGVRVFGVFQPGTEVGETDLIVRVQDERRFYAGVRLDNYGTRYTGQDRFFVDVAVNNLTGAGDRLYGAYLNQFNPTNGRFWLVEYERPIWQPGMSIGVSAQDNPFDVGSDLEQLGLSGQSQIFQVFLRRSLLRSRQENVWSSLTWRRSIATTSQDSIDLFEDDLSVLELEFDFDSIDSRARGINLGVIGFTFGLGDLLGGHGDDEARTQTPPPSRQGGSGQFASNDFYKVYGGYSRLQKLGEEVSLLVRTDGQWTKSLLTSLEQFSIGGPTSVRAYPVAEALTDIGVFGSLELTINAPGFAQVPAFQGFTWGQLLRVSFFTDFAWGALNDPDPSEEDSASFAGYGAGISFGIPGRLQGRLQYATPFGSQRPSDGDTSHWWFDLTYQF
ncbi:MAG: ShlB/FhaC/HecB family hemolysin secretion/activation protein, partial [Gammaproteobacteria bacterium]|nr:ShlB/FhaC/HecB family hemolysin secretion/activation protein [Gammaproteobacteria bacterium]